MARSRDALHETAVSHYRNLARSPTRLITTSYVIAEVATRIRYDEGLTAALTFRDILNEASSTGRLRLRYVDPRLEAEGWRLLEQFADVRLSFTDAVSAAAARAGRCQRVFGFDRHFEALGFMVEPAA